MPLPRGSRQTSYLSAFSIAGFRWVISMSHPISDKPGESITHVSLTRRQIGNGQRLSCRWLLFAARGVLLSPHPRSGVRLLYFAMGHEVRDKKQCPNHPWFPADWMESREYTAEAHSPREIAKGSNVPLVYLPTAQTDGRFWPKGNPKVYRHMVFAC